MNVVIIGGPMAGQGLQVDARRAHEGLTLAERDPAADHFAHPEHRDPLGRPATHLQRYRLVRYVPVAGMTMNLLVRDSIQDADLHTHLAPVFTPQAQAALEGDRA